MKISRIISVVEIRILRWNSGMSRKDKIRTEYVRDSIGMTLKKTRENIN